MTPNTKNSARGAHGQGHAPHCPVAVCATRRPSTCKPAKRPGDEIIEELELLQGVLEVILDTQKRDHSDLRRAQNCVRQ